MGRLLLLDHDKAFLCLLVGCGELFPLLLQSLEALPALGCILPGRLQLIGEVHERRGTVRAVEHGLCFFVLRHDALPLLELFRGFVRLREFRHRLASRIALFLTRLLAGLQSRCPLDERRRLLIARREQCSKLRLIFGIGLCEVQPLLLGDAIVRFADFRGLLLQLVLELLVDFRVKEDLHDLLARARVGHEEAAELALRQQDDLAELLALKAEQPHNARLHLAVARPGLHDSAVFQPLKHDFRRLPREPRAALGLAHVLWIAPDVPVRVAHAERQVNIRIDLRPRLAIAQHARRARLRRRLAVERIANGIKDARLARARRPVNQEERLLRKDGEIETDFFLVRPEGTDGQDFWLHFASLSSR